jgi:hypothetical protein
VFVLDVSMLNPIAQARAEFRDIEDDSTLCKDRDAVGFFALTRSVRRDDRAENEDRLRCVICRSPAHEIEVLERHPSM